MKHGITITVGGKAVVDHARILSQLDGRPDWADSVGTLTLPAGHDPGSAVFLMSRSIFEDENGDPDDVFKFGEHAIKWDYRDAAGELTSLEFKGYRVTRAFSAWQSTDAPLVVTLVDKRFVFARSAEDLEINRTVPTNADQVLKGSDKTGSPYTWAEAFTKLWSIVPQTAGTIDASAITGTPHDIYLDREAAWDHLCRLARWNGYVAVWDPIDEEVLLKKIGETQTEFDALPDDRRDADLDVVDFAPLHAYGNVKTGWDHYPGTRDKLGINQKTAELDSDTNTDAEAKITETSCWLSHPDLYRVEPDADPAKEGHSEDFTGLLATFRTAIKVTNASFDRTYLGIHDIRPGEQVGTVQWRTWAGKVTTRVQSHRFDPPLPDYPRGKLLVGASSFSAVTLEAIAWGEYGKCKLLDSGNNDVIGHDDEPLWIKARNGGHANADNDVESGAVVQIKQINDGDFAIDVEYC